MIAPISLPLTPRPPSFFFSSNQGKAPRSHAPPAAPKKTFLTTRTPFTHPTLLIPFPTPYPLYRIVPLPTVKKSAILFLHHPTPPLLSHDPYLLMGYSSSTPSARPSGMLETMGQKHYFWFRRSKNTIILVNPRAANNHFYYTVNSRARTYRHRTRRLVTHCDPIRIGRPVTARRSGPMISTRYGVSAIIGVHCTAPGTIRCCRLAAPAGAPARGSRAPGGVGTSR
eukprot:746901-Hanusia_phi.AAC.6